MEAGKGGVLVCGGGTGGAAGSLPVARSRSSSIEGGN